MSQPKLNFTAEEDDKLVEAVAAHPAVYDLHHALYKDQRAKDNIWVVIAGEVGRSGMYKIYNIISKSRSKTNPKSIY